MLGRRVRPSYFLALICGVTLAWAAADAVGAQEARPSQESVWDGVYTAGQAERGTAAYIDHCSECHDIDLTGGEGKPLKGQLFWKDWGGDSLDSLYGFVKKRMPANGIGTLQDGTYLDIIAYILQANGLPSGKAELTADRVPRIHVVGKDGKMEAPSGSLVTVVGCITQRGENAWMLTNASEPLRTRNPSRSSDAERDQAAVRPFGEHTFALGGNYPKPPPVNQRVEAKGFLIRGEHNRLTVTSLQVLGDTCAVTDLEKRP